MFLEASNDFNWNWTFLQHFSSLYICIYVHWNPPVIFIGIKNAIKIESQMCSMCFRLSIEHRCFWILISLIINLWSLTSFLISSCSFNRRYIGFNCWKNIIPRNEKFWECINLKKKKKKLGIKEFITYYLKKKIIINRFLI
jgi:hypothetical protein